MHREGRMLEELKERCRLRAGGMWLEERSRPGIAQGVRVRIDQEEGGSSYRLSPKLLAKSCKLHVTQYQVSTDISGLDPTPHCVRAEVMWSLRQKCPRESALSQGQG